MRQTRGVPICGLPKGNYMQKQKRVYKSTTMRLGSEVMCHFCGENEQTVAHILAGCGKLKWGLYKVHHDRVLYQLVKVVGKEMGLKVPKRLRKPGRLARSGVVGTSSRKMLVDVCIPTKRCISERRLDLVTINNPRKKIVCGTRDSRGGRSRNRQSTKNWPQTWQSSARGKESRLYQWCSGSWEA